MAERAADSRLRSELLDSEAADVKNTIDTNLRPTLESDVNAVEILGNLNDQTDQTLAELDAGLNMLPEGGYMDEAEEARDKAMDAQMRAEAARDRIKQVTEDGLDRANELSQLVDDANKAIVDGRQDGKDFFALRSTSYLYNFVRYLDL